MRCRGIGAMLLAGFALGLPPSAGAAVPHTVNAGETLWSISAASNLTTRTVAAFNGLPVDAHVVAGQTIEVPSVTEGAAALVSHPEYGSPLASGGSSTTTAASTAPVASPTPGLGDIPSPWGTLYLAPAAADAWNAMRAESLRLYGIDLYPGGPLSAYRTYAQQAQLYDL